MYLQALTFYDMNLMLCFHSWNPAEAFDQRFKCLELILPSRGQANLRSRMNGLQDHPKKALHINHMLIIVVVCVRDDNL